MTELAVPPYVDSMLLGWLENEWRKSNVPKYRHLFSDWIVNITHEQALGFRHNMTSDYINHKT